LLEGDGPSQAAGLPQPPAQPTQVWINPPTARATEEALLH